MAVIHFSSGQCFTISALDFKHVKERMKNAALRFWDNKRNTLIILSPSNINFIVYDEADAAREMVMNPEIREVPNTRTPDKPMSGQEREMLALAEIEAKANCKHEGTNTLYFEQLAKKGGGEWKRYFRKCSFCGVKSRFVSNDDLTEEEKNQAVVYQET